MRICDEIFTTEYCTTNITNIFTSLINTEIDIFAYKNG